MNLPSSGFYSSSRASGHPTGGQSASTGQPFLLVSNPNFLNSRGLLRQTGSKNPIIDLCANDQRHGHFGCREHQARNKSLNGSPVRCPGTIHSAFVMPPAEPATSSHAVRISPLPSPDRMAIRNVRVARAMGMMTIIRSTNLLPSSRSHSQPASWANSRSARIACVGVMLTSRVTLRGRAMNKADAFQSRGCRSRKIADWHRDHTGGARTSIAGQGAGDWQPRHSSDLSVKRPAYARGAPP